ncbi:hypothetical protein [Haloferula sp. A504]|uniref:hypothetical protein n=1 Tax=Haloferula sp. A504 TaxID=3373601 RepID=UPI0031BCB013|nr:hypothetical protein [Verrucomicrobiaceae bacterium E54]
MSDRYEILDILTQDADGVAFHAEDRETGTEVVLRRFFPFGANGGGLVDEERSAYEIAVRRLMGVSHPALRNVLDGGTDPVDGMPFLVTEWLGGRPLAHRLQDKPLSPHSAKALIDLALETCQVLSEAFQEECVWIETATSSILLNGNDENRQVTFRISPLRWLGEDESRKGLRSLLRLCEEVTGWSRRMLSDGSGDGLGGWIRALRKDPDQWSLEQARYALHYGPAALENASSGVVQNSSPISPPDATIPAQASAPALRSTSSTNWWPWIIAASLTVLAIGFIFWQAYRHRDPAAPPMAAATEEAQMTDVERASARVAELMAEREAANAAANPNPAPAVDPTEDKRLVARGKALHNKLGEVDHVEGQLRQVRASRSGDTIYLELGSLRGPNAICGRYKTKLKVFTEKELRDLVGKRLRLRGKVVKDPGNRIAIDLTAKDTIEVIAD